jgi:MYXO-CTERM domain-containing protein
MKRSTTSVLSSIFIATLAGAAMADTTFLNTVGNGNTGVGSRAAWSAALGNSVASANSFTTGTPAGGGSEGHTTGSIHFTSGVTASITTISSPANAGFFVGRIDGANGLNNGYFDAGDAARPTNNPIAVAFGNNDHFFANQIQITFNPGVSGFGFNFDDVGDVGAVMIVSWSDGVTQTRTLGVADNNRNANQDGFFGLVRSTATLTSITFLQSPGSANDGFSMYDLTVSPSVVPLPPAAMAGLAGLAGAGFIARRRNKQSKAI